MKNRKNMSEAEEQSIKQCFKKIKNIIIQTRLFYLFFAIHISICWAGRRESVRKFSTVGQQRKGVFLNIPNVFQKYNI